MNTTIVSYNINLNVTFPSSQTNHSLINHSPLTQPQPQSCGYSLNQDTDNVTTTTYQMSLIQQLQQQLMLETLIYERMRASYLLHQQHQAILTQREAYVGCDTTGFVNFVPQTILRSSNRIKYSMICELGRGTYSRVFKCVRMDQNRVYAIKVIRNADKYQSAAMHEVDILKHIKAKDVDDVSCCIHILDAGVYYGHPMFVFPLLGDSLRSSITPNNPFGYEQVTRLMWQMCRAVAFIHSLGIIHADLKPENIMFVSHESEWTDLEIKIIDFGAAVFEKNEDTTHHHMIQTREYRAPEVILAKEWSFEVDMWSVGCILVELVCGKVLFPIHSNANHLHRITECIGTRPEDDVDISIPNLNSYFAHTNDELYDLCAQMLCWDPKERISAEKALQHDVFRDYV